jgi:hypothetical protein
MRSIQTQVKGKVHPLYKRADVFEHPPLANYTQNVLQSKPQTHQRLLNQRSYIQRYSMVLEPECGQGAVHAYVPPLWDQVI